MAKSTLRAVKKQEGGKVDLDQIKVLGSSEPAPIAQLKTALTEAAMAGQDGWGPDWETEGTDEADDVVDASEDDNDGQEIIEVDQDEVKRALKLLLTNQSNVIDLLYSKFDEYNNRFFGGELSIPLITVEKLSNRTLANYTFGENNIPIKNHIRFNLNFIALNQGEDGQCVRILETLRHEMIHQWQDQIIYALAGVETFKPYKKAVLTSEGEVEYVDAVQKKRPKDWHNPDFKELAAVVGILANGPKCSGNPAKMPAPKSYNRKFRCGCIASNHHPLTIWSTRPVYATCDDCGNPFVEVVKIDPRATTIEVSKSHIERPGEDAIMSRMQAQYRYFERLDSKLKKDSFIENLTQQENVPTELAQGVYQKGHNAYALGYRYWVAYSTSEVNPDTVIVNDETKLEEDKPLKIFPPTKSKKAKVEPPVEAPVVEPESIVEAELEEVESEPYPYSIDRPEDLMRAYRETGSTRAAAVLFGVNPTTFQRRAAKYGLDFKAGMQ